jgi:hypothetical protein
MSGLGIQVNKFKDIGLNLSKSKAPNINREIENDKSAPLIVTKVVNLSFKNFDIEFKNIETIKGTNITTNKIYSNLTPR